MSSLQERKKLKEQGLKKDEKPKENNWQGFGMSLLKGIINLVILVILGSNMIFSMRNMANDKFLPINIFAQPYNVPPNTPFIKAFPYIFVKNPTTYVHYIQNWFAKTMQYTWVFIRGFMRGSFNALNEITNISMNDMQDPNNKMSSEYILRYIIESSVILFSPLILIFISILVGSIGFFSTLAGGFFSPQGFINKLFGLGGAYFLSFIVSFLQGIWALFFIAIKPFTISLSHFKPILKKFDTLFLLCFLFIFLNASFSNLVNEINIGIVVGLIFLFGGTILRSLYKTNKANNSITKSI